MLADHSGEQVQPRLLPIADGGFYVSWFDDSTGGYDVYLQRLDASGTEQWAHDGVLVADRGFGWTTDYGLGMDTTGNALLAFRDDSGATVEVTVCRVAPDGTMLWGAGVQVSSGGSFVAAPQVAGTSDGNVVVAWTSDDSVKVQKLDSDGVALWSPEVTLTPATGSYSISDLHASDTGTAIVSFTHMIGSYPSDIHLVAQKLASSDGASLWTAGHVQVFDGGSLQLGSFPTFVGDGAGGGVFSWYSSAPSLQCRVQRVLAGGSEAFAHNGVEVSTNAAQVRVSPSVAFSSSTQETFVAWMEMDTSQSQRGVSIQKLDAAGLRQWTDSGLGIVALGTDAISNVAMLAFDDGAIVTWEQSPSYGIDPVYAARVDGTGAFSWTPAIIDLCTQQAITSGLKAALSARGFAAYAWSSDNGSYSGDIVTARLNGDGSLGVTEIFADGFESGDTSRWSASTP